MLILVLTVYHYDDVDRVGPGDHHECRIKSERPVWVISCLMIVLWSGITRMDEISSLNWRGNAIVKSCESGSLRCYRCINTLLLFYRLFGILAAIAITLVWQRHTRFFISRKCRY